MTVVALILTLILLYAYIGYPLLLRLLAKEKKIDCQAYTSGDELPPAVIIIPVQNEEKVIAAKVESILWSAYPKDKLQLYIGLDACTDNTLNILQKNFSFPNIQLVEFAERTGKPGVLNHIIAEQDIPQDAILILTDANVLFTTQTVPELVRYFKDERVGLVDAHLLPAKVSNENESDYWNYETDIKSHESIAFGIIPGPSGGCYAIRRSLYTPVPNNFLVDDFFIGFHLLTQGYKALLNMDAVCYEDVTTDWLQEFRRKLRISAGNFQNLWHFRKYAFAFNALGFVFCSHKVLRWKTPFMLLLLYALLLCKAPLFILIVTLCLPIIDALFFTFGLEFKPLRRFDYFIVMNLAVFSGFIKFCKGVKSNVWQPTIRK